MNFRKDVIYRCIGNDFSSGVIACGYMPKPTAQSSQYQFVIDYYSCFIVLSGTGTYSDKLSGCLPLTKGSFVQRFPGRIHSTEINPDGKWLEFFISFGKPVYNYMDQLGLLPKTPVTCSSFNFASISLLDNLLFRLKNVPDSGYPGILLDLQKTVLDLSCPADSQQHKDNIPESIRQACTILSSDFSKSIELSQLAGQLNLSYESFRKQFKKAIGSSPGSFRKEQRLKQAALLLKSGVSIKEAALMTGYADSYAFTREFSKAMGCPPGKYRKI